MTGAKFEPRSITLKALRGRTPQELREGASFLKTLGEPLATSHAVTLNYTADLVGALTWALELLDEDLPVAQRPLWLAAKSLVTKH